MRTIPFDEIIIGSDRQRREFDPKRLQELADSIESKGLLHPVVLRIVEGIAHRPGKGAWQVLQVQTFSHGWQVVFSRADMPEHYTVNEKLMPTVRKFLESRK